ncbi:male-specific lethal 3-like protein, partial [Dinothrombium tinctorium]
MVSKRTGFKLNFIGGKKVLCYEPVLNKAKQQNSRTMYAKQLSRQKECRVFGAFLRMELVVGSVRVRKRHSAGLRRESAVAAIIVNNFKTRNSTSAAKSSPVKKAAPINSASKKQESSDDSKSDSENKEEETAKKTVKWKATKKLLRNNQLSHLQKHQQDSESSSESEDSEKTRKKNETKSSTKNLEDAKSSVEAGKGAYKVFSYEDSGKTNGKNSSNQLNHILPGYQPFRLLTETTSRNLSVCLPLKD